MKEAVIKNCCQYSAFGNIYAVFYIVLFIQSQITEVAFSYQFLTYQNMYFTIVRFKQSSRETSYLKNGIMVVISTLLRILKIHMKVELSEQLTRDVKFPEALRKLLEKHFFLWGKRHLERKNNSLQYSYLVIKMGFLILMERKNA